MLLQHCDEHLQSQYRNETTPERALQASGPKSGSILSPTPLALPQHLAPPPTPLRDLPIQRRPRMQRPRPQQLHILRQELVHDPARDALDAGRPRVRSLAPGLVEAEHAAHAPERLVRLRPVRQPPVLERPQQPDNPHANGGVEPRAAGLALFHQPEQAREAPRDPKAVLSALTRAWGPRLGVRVGVRVGRVQEPLLRVRHLDRFHEGLQVEVRRRRCKGPGA